MYIVEPRNLAYPIPQFVDSLIDCPCGQFEAFETCTEQGTPTQDERAHHQRCRRCKLVITPGTAAPHPTVGIAVDSFAGVDLGENLDFSPWSAHTPKAMGPDHESPTWLQWSDTTHTIGMRVRGRVAVQAWIDHAPADPAQALRKLTGDATRAGIEVGASVREALDANGWSGRPAWSPEDTDSVAGYGQMVYHRPGEFLVLGVARWGVTPLWTTPVRDAAHLVKGRVRELREPALLLQIISS